MKNSSIETYAKILAIGTAFICQSHVSAQSALIGTLPMQVNPAFAGAAGSPRIGTSSYLVSYNSKSSIGYHNSNRQNFSFSYDNFIPKI